MYGLDHWVITREKSVETFLRLLDEANRALDAYRQARARGAPAAEQERLLNEWRKLFDKAKAELEKHPDPI